MKIQELSEAFNDWCYQWMRLKKSDKIPSDKIEFMRRMMGCSLNMSMLEDLRKGKQTAPVVMSCVRDMVRINDPKMISVFRRDEKLLTTLKKIDRDKKPPSGTDSHAWCFLYLSYLNKYFQTGDDIQCQETKALWDKLFTP